MSHVLDDSEHGERFAGKGSALRRNATGRWRKVATFTGSAALGGVLLGGTLYAVVTSAALRGAGFAAADGEVNGAKPTAAEKTKITDAITKLGTIAGNADCVKCLNDMCKNGRICTETGTANETAGATTLPDKKAGCDPKAEGINVNPTSMAAPVEVLACMLGHEWCHTNQKAADFAGDFESPCYQAEIDCLKALGQDQAGTPGKARYDQMVQCLADLQKPAQVPPKTEPFNGGAIRYDQGACYSVSSSFPRFHGISSNWLAAFDYPLQMTIPFDFAILDHVLGGSQSVALVCGLNEPIDTGVIQRLVIQDGQVPIELVPLSLVSIHPFRVVHDPSRAVAYLLDTRGDQVLRLIDTDADLVPDTLDPTPFATAGAFPELANAFGMSLNVGASGPSLFLDQRDSRAFGAVRFDEPRTVLFDNDANGVAESSLTMLWQDLIAFMPGYLSSPQPGDTSVHVYAGTGVPVQVELTDSTGTQNLGVLANSVVPVGVNEVVVSLGQSLQPGQFIRTLDLDNPTVGSFPLEITLRGASAYCTQTKATTVPSCTATLSCTDLTLATGTWNVANVPLGPASGGATIGIFIYTQGIGIGQSAFSATISFGTLCLAPGSFLRSAPTCAPVTISGGGTNVCHPGFPPFSPNCSAGGLGISVGEDVNAQCWYRDPGAVGNANLSNAIFYTVL